MMWDAYCTLYHLQDVVRWARRSDWAIPWLLILSSMVAGR